MIFAFFLKFKSLQKYKRIIFMSLALSHSIVIMQGLAKRLLNELNQYREKRKTFVNVLADEVWNQMLEEPMTNWTFDVETLDGGKEVLKLVRTFDVTDRVKKIIQDVRGSDEGKCTNLEIIQEILLILKNILKKKVGQDERFEFYYLLPENHQHLSIQCLFDIS